MSEDEIGQPRSDPNGPSYHPLSQIKAVERKAVFSCKFCKTKFPLMIQKKAHSIPKKVTCSRCGYESQSKCEFYKHRAEHEKDTCQDCGDELITTWADHKRRRKVMCFLGSCLGLEGGGKVFLSNCSYQRHVNSDHGGGSQVVVFKAQQIGDIIVGADNNNQSSSSSVSGPLSQRTKRAGVSMGKGVTAEFVKEENNDESTSSGEKLDPGPVIVSTTSLRVKVNDNRGRGNGRGGSERKSSGFDGRGPRGGRGRGVGGRGRHRGVGGRGSGGSKVKQDQLNMYNEGDTGINFSKVLHPTDQLLHDVDEHLKTSFKGTEVVEKKLDFVNGLYNTMDVRSAFDGYLVPKSPEIEETVLGL